MVVLDDRAAINPSSDRTMGFDADTDSDDSVNSGSGMERVNSSGGGQNFRVSLLEKLQRTKAWQPREARPPAHQTVVIFDWDDTLLCTTYLDPGREYYYRGPKKSPQALHNNLRSIASLGKALLEQSADLGKTFIVTNAVEGWVQDCIERYCPEMMPLLESNTIEVVSARTKYGPLYPNDVMRWKKEAFLEIKERYNMDPTILTNIIALGDAEYEMDAAKDLSRQFEQVFTKTVKFQPQPTSDDLLKELTLVSQSFPRILNHAKNLKISLERRQQPPSSQTTD